MPRASALATRQIRHRRASSACCGAHCRCAAGVQAQTRLRARGARRRARRGRRAARRGRRARSGLGRRCVYKCAGLCAGRIRQPGQQGFRWGRDDRQDLRRGAFHHAKRGGPLGDATGNNPPSQSSWPTSRGRPRVTTAAACSCTTSSPSRPRSRPCRGSFSTSSTRATPSTCSPRQAAATTSRKAGAAPCRACV